MDLIASLNRAAELTSHRPTLSPSRRMAAAAEAISLAGDDQLHLDAATAAVTALITVLYEQEPDGNYPNVDYATGRILIPLPWGNSGWRQWGLRHWEARTLRKIMLSRVGDRRQQPAPFAYANNSRQWYLETEYYPTAAAAAGWLERYGPTLNEWRHVSSHLREAQADRMRAYRTAV